MDIDYLLYLQSVRDALPPWVGTFFMVVSDIVISPLFLLPACYVYWCLDKHRGLRVVFSYCLATFFTNLTKVTLCVFRPWMRDPRVEPFGDAVETATGYSFPSGHTQAATSVLVTLGWLYRDWRRWVLPATVAGALLVALSRNVLGVHTPQDVLAGFACGILFIWVGGLVLKWGEQPDHDTKVLLGALCVAVASCVFVAIKSYPEAPASYADHLDLVEMELDFYQATGAFLGGILGWWGERRLVRFEPKIGALKGLWRMVVGAVVILICRYGVALPLELLENDVMLEFVKGLMTALGVVLFAPWAISLCERFWPRVFA